MLRATRVRVALAPVACAIANLVAAVAMATVLAPGTPLVADPSERTRYVDAHLLVWRLGWGSWVLAALTLVWMYAWWTGRTNASRTPLVIACIGLVADLSAELTLIAGAFGDATLAFFLTGAVANLLYTIAGVQLTAATRLSVRGRTYAAFMWSAGLMVSLGSIVGVPLVTAIGTGILFVLFIPWCLYLARVLA